MGIVYYSRYLEFFEQARTETLNNINLKIKDLEILGYYLPVIKVECIYQKSVRLEDIINIKFEYLASQNLSFVLIMMS